MSAMSLLICGMLTQPFQGSPLMVHQFPLTEQRTNVVKNVEAWNTRLDAQKKTIWLYTIPSQNEYTLFCFKFSDKCCLRTFMGVGLCWNKNQPYTLFPLPSALSQQRTFVESVQRRFNLRRHRAQRPLSWNCKRQNEIQIAEQTFNWSVYHNRSTACKSWCLNFWRLTLRSLQRSLQCFCVCTSDDW